MRSPSGRVLELRLDGTVLVVVENGETTCRRFVSQEHARRQLDALIAANAAGGFIELGEESTGAVGRPVRPLEIAPDLGCFTGVKITGDAAYAVLTDARAQVLAERTLPLITTTPDAVVARLHAATLAALKDPAVAARMESQAGFIIGGSPAELDAVVAREIRQYTQVVREQGLKPE